MAAKEKVSSENLENPATVALTEELRNLRLQMNHWKQAQDTETANRVKLEKTLRDDIEKQKRELEEEKHARQTEKHRHEREKESDWEKFRSAVDERIAHHNEASNRNNAAHNTESHRQHQGARARQPRPSTVIQDYGPPPYSEGEVSSVTNSVEDPQSPHKERNVETIGHSIRMAWKSHNHQEFMDRRIPSFVSRK